MELVMVEDAGIFCIKAKHDANTKNVEPAQGFIGAVAILFQQGVINTANNFASLHRDAHLLGDMPAFGVNQELQPIMLFAQVFQQDTFRLAIRKLHVVNQKLSKVASDNPARML